MKIKLMLGLALIILTGCVEHKYRAEDGTAYDIVIIDGCQYLKFYSYGGHDAVTHKGDCNNPIHKN